MPRYRSRYYDDPYDYPGRSYGRRDNHYPGRYYRRQYFNGFKVFLIIVGFLVTFAVLYVVYMVLSPYLPIIVWVFVAIAAFVILAGLVWVCLKLYGLLQEQLTKKESRDIVRVSKSEQVVVRERKTRDLKLLRDELPPPALAVARSRAAYPVDDEDSPRAIAPPREPASPPANTVIHYASIQGSIKPGQVLMGIRTQDKTLRLGEWDDVKTVLVLGASASGKTNTIAEKTSEAVQGGAWIVPCDPHAHKNESLFRRIAPLASSLYPGAVFAVQHEDILRNIQAVRTELERRVNGGGSHRPVVLVVDEWNRLQRDETIAHELMMIAETLGQEGRGFGIYGIFGTQRITGNVALRKSVVSAIVHRCDESEAKLVVPQRYARLVPELPNGLSFVRDADGVTELLQQVLISSRDIELIASSYTPHPLQAPTAGIPRRQTQPFTQPMTLNSRGIIPASPNVQEQAKRPLEQGLARSVSFEQTAFLPQRKSVPNRTHVAEKQRQEILTLARAGMSRRKIKDTLGLHGAKYEIVRQVLDEAGL